MNNLIFRAGPQALALIHGNGLSPDQIKMIGGAAGGPKWLILGHLDRLLFGDWFAGRKAPLFLVGSSSGAWRFAAACQPDPIAALDRFEEAYIHQFYDHQPTPAEVSREGWRILNSFIDSNGAAMVAHPFLRLNIMSVRCRGLTASPAKPLQSIGLLLAAVANLIDRRALKLFFERVLFYDPRDRAPFFGMNEFPIHRIPLDLHNIKKALIASGSIPLLMDGVTDIPGAPQGMYRDGAIIDYHMDLPFGDHDGIFLLPHYTDRIIPGWLDKKLVWRRPQPEHLTRMLLVTPSPQFIRKLPYHKIPDRTDFKRFHRQDRYRLDYWNKAVELSRLLADEFKAVVESGEIVNKVLPL